MPRKYGRGSRGRAGVYFLDDAIARAAQQGLLKVPPHLAQYKRGQVLKKPELKKAIG